MCLLTGVLCAEQLEEIDFVDRPDIELPGTADGDGGEAAKPSESVSMPFKYVKGADGKPIMPEVCHIVQV